MQTIETAWTTETFEAIIKNLSIRIVRIIKILIIKPHQTIFIRKTPIFRAIITRIIRMTQTETIKMGLSTINATTLIKMVEKIHLIIATGQMGVIMVLFRQTFLPILRVCFAIKQTTKLIFATPSMSTLDVSAYSGSVVASFASALIMVSKIVGPKWCARFARNGIRTLLRSMWRTWADSMSLLNLAATTTVNMLSRGSRFRRSTQRIEVVVVTTSIKATETFTLLLMHLPMARSNHRTRRNW